MRTLGVGPILSPWTSIASHGHRLDIWNPDGPPVADAGEYVQAYKFDGHVYAVIEPATAQRAERYTRGGAVASTTHVISTYYVTNIVVNTRLLFVDQMGTHRFDVLGYGSNRMLPVELIVLCQEFIAPPLALTGRALAEAA
jgi:hypothetical protein